MSEEKPNLVGDLQIVRGIPFPSVIWFESKNIEDAMDYLPKDDDVIIASYPKTGTTWMQYIILQIVSKGESFPTFDNVTYKVVPFIEMSGIAAVEALESKPRVYKHHIPYNMEQKNDKAKYIYIYRHLEDTIVSFYHFSNNLHFETFNQHSFDQFYDAFLTGNIGYGCYFKHVLSFYERREDGNLLLVSYEKLHANRKEEILRIAWFLGAEYHDCLLEDEVILNNVLEHTSFDYMKKNLHLTNPNRQKAAEGIDPAEKPKVNFFRKGIVGDGKSHLSDDQRAKLKETAQKIMKGTPIIDDWYPK